MRFFEKRLHWSAPNSTENQLQVKETVCSKEHGNRLLKWTAIRIADDFSFIRGGHIGSVPVEHYFFVLHKSWSTPVERSKSLKKTVCSIGALEPLLKKTHPMAPSHVANARRMSSASKSSQNRKLIANSNADFQQDMLKLLQET